MAIFDLRTFGDIVDSIQEALQISSTDTTSINRIKRDINTIYAEVVGRKKWYWLSGSADISIPAYINTGTVSVTENSASVTLTIAPSSSKAGFFFAVDGYSEIYTIESHAAGSTQINLKTEYTGNTNSAVTYKIWTNRVPLPNDCIETAEVWHETYHQTLQNVGRNEYRRISSRNSRTEGAPAIYYTGDFKDPSQASLIPSLPSITSRSSSLMVKTIIFSSSLPSAVTNKLTAGDPVNWRISSAGEPSYNGDVVITTIATTNTANDTVTYIGSSELTEAATSDTGISISQLDTPQEYSRYRELYIFPALRNVRTTLHVDYFKHVLPLENDNDEPLIPKEDRIVLRHGALDLAWSRARNDAQAARSRALYDARLAQMEGKWQSSIDSARLIPSRQYLNSKRKPTRLLNNSIEFGLPISTGSSGGSGGVNSGQISNNPDTVAVFGNDGNLTASNSVSTGELNFIHGVTSSVQSQLNAITALPDGQIRIGDSSNTAQPVTVSGDITLSNSGVSAITTNVIVDADINSAAAITRTKIANGTANRILINNSSGTFSENAALSASKVVLSDANGQLISSVVTPSEVSFLSGAEPLVTLSLNDFQILPSPVGAWNVSLFNSLSIIYSLKRGVSNIETGIINIVSDGTIAAISVGAVASLGTSGVTFSADVNSGSVRLLYTSTATGAIPTLTYKLNKWLTS